MGAGMGTGVKSGICPPPPNLKNESELKKRMKYTDQLIYSALPGINAHV
jgi:hypothetical protein